MCGNLELIIGPMFSGKSTELIRKIRLLQKIEKKILVIKPIIDTRYNQTKITSHNFESVDCITINRLDEISDETVQQFHSIIIDEGQFFSDLVSTVKKWVDNYNVNIIVGGLNGDFQRQPFGAILDLIPYADECIKLSSLCSICKDGTKAPFTFRLLNLTDKILVGGSESYIAICRKHYNELNKKNENLI